MCCVASPRARREAVSLQSRGASASGASRPGLRLEVGDRVDLDEDAADGRYATCTVARAGGSGPTWRCVDLVHRLEVVEVREEDRRLQELLRTRARFLEDRARGSA